MTQVKMPEPDIFDGTRLDGSIASHGYSATALEAYAAAKVREALEWQPIETAPKDGTVVMVCNEDGTWIAKYVPFYPSGCRAENPWFSLMLNHDHLRKARPYRPTHWMPLPAPPLPGPVEPTT